MLFGNEAFGQRKHNILFPPPVLEFHDLIDFCETPDHKNELVYTRAEYSYANKQWSLHAENGKCKAITANMFLSDSNFLNARFQKALKAVKQSPQHRYLVIDIIGFFQDDLSGDEHGIGDMGENKYRFIVKNILDVSTGWK